jgi:uncharacterized protein YbjT (DUF2867 family)
MRVRGNVLIMVQVKSTLEQKLAYSDYPWKTTILGPTLFYDNDIRSKDSMLKEGLFDEPLGEKGVARVSPSDIALAVANAIAEPDVWAGKKIMLGSKHRYTGKEVAALWSKAIGREVKMLGSDRTSLDRFEENLDKVLGASAPGSEMAGWPRDLRLMYEAFATVGFGMCEEEYDVQVKLLGKVPEDYEPWVAETGERWL